MKTRLSLLTAAGLFVLLFLTFWLVLGSDTVSAGQAPAEELLGTIVGGDITTDTTWTPEGSPYIVQSQNVRVVDGVKLTIEPKVTVELNAGLSLWVYGTLVAVGTPTEPITFTRMAGVNSPWGTVQVGGGSVQDDSNDSQISYATIEGGGSGAQMLYTYFSAPALDHLTVRNSRSRGVYVANVPAGFTLSWDTGTVTGNLSEGVWVTTGRVAFSNLNVVNNTTDGIELSSADDSQLLNSTVQGSGGNGIHSSGSDRLLLEGLTIAGNAGYGIRMQSGGGGSILRNTSVQGNGVAAQLHPDISLENVSWSGNTRSEIEWITGQMYSSRTWARLPEIDTYRVLGHIYVEDNTTLTIEPGVTVGVQAGTNLYGAGIVSAVGTPTEPITFTRMEGVNQPWGYLQIGGGTPGDSDASRLSYVTIEGGGSGSSMLYLLQSGATLDHLTLRNSSGKGLNASTMPAGSALSWDTGTVTGNAGEGIYVYSGQVVLSNLNVADNGADGVEFGSVDEAQLLNSTVQGNGGNGIHTSGCDGLLLEGLTIAGNAGYGIYMQSYGVGSIVRDTTVQGNGVAARLHPDVSLENVSWTGNTRSEIEWIGGLLYSSRTWARLPEISTYVVLADITSPDDTTLTVEPGVTVQLQEYSSIFANGGLSAVGTESQPITFTRLPGAAHPWGMIQIGGGNVHGDSDDSRVSYATIEGGGSGGKLVHLYYTSAEMDHVAVQNSSSIGIQVTPWAGTQVTLDTVVVTNNTGAAVYHNQPGPSLSYRNLTLQGNGADEVSIGSGSIGTLVQWDLDEAAVPVRTGSLYVDNGGMLSLTPGSRLEFTAGAGLEVWYGSGLYALGTPNAPITLTATVEQPGAWKGVWLKGNSHAILRNCNLEYGGAAGEPALKIQTLNAVVVNSAVRHAAGEGIQVYTGQPGPVLRNDDVSGNAFGLRNMRTDFDVDARQVWWGDASGPYHPTLNPGGLGNAVSDHVLFQPWLTSVPTGTLPLGGLLVRTAGPLSASLGKDAFYGATYLNETGQEIQDAVLLLALPETAAFIESYGGPDGAEPGLYRPERYQVFWRLGTVPPGEGGSVIAHLRYYWGIPGHTATVMALMAGSNQGETVFDLDSYLAYEPVTVLSTTPMTPEEVAAERRAYPTLDGFFVEGEAQGFVYTSAERFVVSPGRNLVDITLDRQDPEATMHIVREGQAVYAYFADSATFTLHTLAGDVLYDRATNTFTYSGGMGGGSGGAASTPTQGALSFADEWAGAPQTYPSYEDCLQNCLEEKVERIIIKACLRYIMKKPPLKREDAVEVAKCMFECEDDPTSHYCIADQKFCDWSNPWFPGTAQRVMSKECDTDTGKLNPLPDFISQCSIMPVEKCIVQPNGNPQCVQCEDAGGCDDRSTSVFTPKDPNAKYGPAGDLLPGDPVAYTVAYENVGEGEAFGVYVEDTLSEAIDENTLAIGDGGVYMPASRTILWEIGELGPKGSPTASGTVTFTASLRTGLPGGTPIVNQAVVYFPTVPEETPTNQVLNVIWPVVGVPMTVTVEAGHSIPITLAGRDTGQDPLTFEVVDVPARGTLAGSPPNLTYTPRAGFSGLDLFTFTASNAITESHPAAVTVVVLPDPSDTTVPEVIWTAPENRAVVPVSASPAFTDTIGAAYMPYVILGFSEAIDESTVTADTLRLTGPDGSAIPITVYYSSLDAEAVATMRQPLAPASTYTVRATQGIRDVAGNAMAADYVFTFRTPGGGGNVYIPLVMRTR